MRPGPNSTDNFVMSSFNTWHLPAIYLGLPKMALPPLIPYRMAKLFWLSSLSDFHFPELLDSLFAWPVFQGQFMQNRKDKIKFILRRSIRKKHISKLWPIILCDLEKGTCSINYVSLFVSLFNIYVIVCYTDVLQPQNFSQQIQGKPFPVLMNLPWKLHFPLWLFTKKTTKLCQICQYTTKRLCQMEE